uniref:Uncharacterized protein n=1 Tax=Siphoviridae sp. ctvuW5 TaxID=2825725 RepID=A0A8S5TX83_9CAUD|nr:MAG TPA: hypothetical protein [Siphoviridae sp. ctvuW5]DAO48692.1 MAG TPA: hypothetical protein [Caudoviricetes sp.]
MRYTSYFNSFHPGPLLDRDTLKQHHKNIR